MGALGLLPGGSTSRGHRLLKNVHARLDRACLLLPAAKLSSLSTATSARLSNGFPHQASFQFTPTAQSAGASQNRTAVRAPALAIQEGVQRGMWGTDRENSCPLLVQGGSQSWGLGLPLALGLDLKENRLIRRREKLPAFFRTLGVAVVLERSSCDWLRPASFCRGLRRKMSLVPLRRKLTLWSLRLRVSRAPVDPVSDSTSSTDGLSEMSERVVSSASWTLVGLERASRAPGDVADGSEGGDEGPPLAPASSCTEASREAA